MNDEKKISKSTRKFCKFPWSIHQFEKPKTLDFSTWNRFGFRFLKNTEIRFGFRYTAQHYLRHGSCCPLHRSVSIALGTSDWLMLASNVIFHEIHHHFFICGLFWNHVKINEYQYIKWIKVIYFIRKEQYCRFKF